jgi:hypothetical protein
MKRALTITLILGLATTLRACSGGQQGGGDSASPDQQATRTNTPTSSHPDPPLGFKLEFTIHQDN